MKLASAIEGGLAGASTLTLLQEALNKFDNKAPRPLLHRSGIIKKIKKTSNKGGAKARKLYIKLAGEVLGSTAFYGLSALGKKKNAVLRGGLLGMAAGLGSAFLQDDKGTEANGLQSTGVSNTKDKLVTITLYTMGGLLAGLAVKKLGKKRKKK
ncbi:MAG TPA: hypothetical protein VFR58_04350 [Flavisolibacter sp.]|nr:hypothetical protein [Flavisolibacter sp.]